MEKDQNTLLLILIAAVILLFLFTGFGMGGYGMMGFGMGFGFLFMLLFWGAVIWLAVTLINSTQHNKEGNSDPLAILKKRFAKGEITKKQFEEMKKEIKG
ncbi:MAG TPA: SHOCT domain-containing protein [archaeon]|nr:SHOCT domain-containing protein [archaeon]